MFALLVFTLVAIMGLFLAVDHFKGRPSDRQFAVAHAILAVIGSALVILDALQGDTRVFINIGLAVVIIALGLVLSIRKHKTGVAPKGILFAHAALAVVCYLILGYFVVVPN
ncbi:hypothetical protein RP726_04580 [Candidatus Methylospira mobilis]|uniref:hypothetical protein n=1 Tax=Candidatus Methylospira mobilis TaxID=1808979 RepID=UPI0028EA8F8D|nr:hypothetical protein [Candidatus Methylospira mobilis]WNV05699.1 hypothetical protein RP726_04580 [Candidatus Methylospira mobilis]